MNSGLEDLSGNKLELAGPLVVRLSLTDRRKHHCSFIFPWQMFRRFFFEGTELTWLSRTRNRKWCPRSIALVAMEWKKYFRHLDLRKRTCSERHFSRRLDKSGKENSVYQGRSAVVVSDRTPFIFEFSIEQHKGYWHILHSTIHCAEFGD